MIDEAEYLAERQEQWEAGVRARHGLSRRQALKLAAAAAAPLVLPSFPRFAGAQTPAPSPVPGIRKALPAEWFIPLGTNAEMRWEAMRGAGFTTPNARFFVRNHTSTPAIDPSTWRLQVFGSGLRDQAGRSFSLRALEKLPRKTVTAFVECAGNGRSYFDRQQGTKAPGSQWGLGAIGVARWTGVPLREVLERAGVTKAAVDVMPQGLDPTVKGADGADQGHVRRPLPIAKALDDALLAYEMNGRDLPADHGAPLRLIVPGWVGIASVKWVGSLDVAAQALFSPWNTTQYRMVGPDYPADAPPLTAQQVKSAFELPFPATLPARRRLSLHGRSWSGDRPIRRVDVRMGGGPGERHREDWRPARLHGPNLPHAWVRWSVDWHRPPAGEYELIARATDRAGTTQPDTVPFNTGGYQFWATVRHPVTVVA
jgi:DMSO/TMAO reductase YedYZ molybdopterin-dependent catalytic subunit